jgi:hypothetical protein
VTTFHTPETAAAEQDLAAFETSRTDLSLSGRAVMTAQHLAGLIAAAELETAGRPSKLPMDLFPEADPVVVQEVWERAFVVGMYTARLAARPYFYRDQLERLRGELAAAGHSAMAGMVARSMATALSEHPADGESEGRGHDEG